VLHQHAAAVLACLISGLDVFGEGYPEHSKSLRVIKGIHGLHVYATEYWTDYLLSEASRHGGISSNTCCFRLARHVASKLEEFAPSNVQQGESDPGHSDDRLLLLGQHETLRKHVKRSLHSRTIEQLERELQNEQSDNTPQPSTPPDGILAMLMAYRQCVTSILNHHDFPGVSAEELELFKRQFHTSAFTCRLKSCPRATVGFDSAQLLREHELSHVCRLRCAFPGCHYPPFSSAQALRRHGQRVHQPNQTPRPIRRVGNFGQNQSAKSIERIEIDRKVSANLKTTEQIDREAERSKKWGSALERRAAERKSKWGLLPKSRSMATDDDAVGTQKSDLQTHPGSLSSLPSSAPRSASFLPPLSSLRFSPPPAPAPPPPPLPQPWRQESLLAANSADRGGDPLPQTSNNGQTRPNAHEDLINQADITRAYEDSLDDALYRVGTDFTVPTRYNPEEDMTTPSFWEQDDPAAGFPTSSDDFMAMRNTVTTPEGPDRLHSTNQKIASPESFDVEQRSLWHVPTATPPAFRPGNKVDKFVDPTLTMGQFLQMGESQTEDRIVLDPEWIELLSHKTKR
jgi:hypothetical protein